MKIWIYRIVGLLLLIFAFFWFKGCSGCNAIDAVRKPAKTVPATKVETEQVKSPNHSEAENISSESSQEVNVSNESSEQIRDYSGEKASQSHTDSYEQADLQKDYLLVNTFFGTDRNSYTSRGELKFGIERSGLKYGKCTVSIPKIHKIGNIESPSILKFEFKENDKKHIVVKERILFDKDYFHHSINMQKSLRSFVFVHGFNVSFDEAAKRTAQMTYDMEFEGTPIFYSWPSKSSLLGYTYDSDNIEYTEGHLKSFIVDIIEKCPDQQLHFIGHSMGSRGLTKALANVFRDYPQYSDRVSQIILAAPDIDAEIFRNNIAPYLTSKNRNITLYSSSNDYALKASELVNGNDRLGDTKPNIFIHDGIETIDASSTKDGILGLGHSYFGAKSSIIYDIDMLLDLGLKAEFRTKSLDKVIQGDKHFWKIK